MTKYLKQPISIQQQISQLKSQGMIFDDEKEAQTVKVYTCSDNLSYALCGTN